MTYDLTKSYLIEIIRREPLFANWLQVVLCDNGLTNYFQNLIGVLRWIVELGQIDIAFEVSSLSKFLSYPRTGHIY